MSKALDMLYQFQNDYPLYFDDKVQEAIEELEAMEELLKQKDDHILQLQDTYIKLDRKYQRVKQELEYLKVDA